MAGALLVAQYVVTALSGVFNGYYFWRRREQRRLAAWALGLLHLGVSIESAYFGWLAWVAPRRGAREELAARLGIALGVLAVGGLILRRFASGPGWVGSMWKSR